MRRGGYVVGEACGGIYRLGLIPGLVSRSGQPRTPGRENTSIPEQGGGRGGGGGR